MFTALHEEFGRIDATRPDLGCGLEWARIHRARPRVRLLCPHCRHPVHAKGSGLDLRFFAHDPHGPHCDAAGESLEHHLLKLELATAARAAGWFAHLEERGAGGWRADVLATRPDGERSIAWEAQLSGITVPDLRTRTERYAADGVAVCWVSTRRPFWLGSQASIRVEPPDEFAPWTVAAGLVRYSAENWEWEPVRAPLSAFVGWALGGQVRPHRFERAEPLDPGRWWSIGWTAPRYVADLAEHKAAVARWRRQRTEHAIDELRRGSLRFGRVVGRPPE